MTMKFQWRNAQIPKMLESKTAFDWRFETKVSVRWTLVVFLQSGPLLVLNVTSVNGLKKGHVFFFQP